MDFRVLGGLEVIGPRQAGPPPGVKERAILARLLVEPGRPVSADALIEAAWGEVPRDAAARSLTVRIANLRAFLEPDRARGSAPVLLQRDRGGYRLAIEPEQVDAQRFEQAIRHAATLPPAAAVDAYDAALELWRGEPFADIAYADFAQAEVERLEELRRQAIECRARVLIEVGRAGDAASGLRKLAVEDPLREELVRTQMLALYAAGRQVDALAAYRDLAERLTEIGLKPAADTRELERRILVQDPTLRREAAPAAAPAPAPMTAAPDGAAGDRDAPVARDAELDQLDESLARALSGRRSVVAISGEPGVGKTKLVEAFLESSVAREGALASFGQCVEHRGPGEPYMPVLEAIGALAAGDDAERVVTTLAQYAPTWLAELPWLLDADDLEALRQRILGATRERMLREIITAIEVLATDRPLVLVLEDAHWADPSTLDLIGALARRRRPVRLLVVISYLPVDGRTHAAQPLVRDLAVHGLGVEVRLGRLDSDAVAGYLEQRYPGSEAPERLGPLLARRSGGNPLFMRHLVDHWEQRGSLTLDGNLTVSPDELAAGVPDTLRCYIDEQVASAGPEAVELLVAGAVAGRSFSSALVAHALDRDPGDVDPTLVSLARRTGVIEPLGDGYRFGHDLYREVLYESVPPEQRSLLHRRIGAFLEDAHHGRVRDFAAELAHHYVAGGDASGAVRFLRLAAERAFARNAYPEGVRHVRAALGAAARLEEGTQRTRAEVELLSQLGQALVAIGGWGSPDAEEALVRARGLATQLDDNEPLVSVLLALATLYEVRGEIGRAKEIAQEYLEHGDTEPAARRLQAEELLACNEFHEGAFARALEHAEVGLELFGDTGGDGHYSTFPATIGDNAGVACHDWAGLALWYLGQPDQALARARSALEMAGDPGRQYSLASARAQLAVIHQCRQEPRQTLEWAEATIDAAEERGYAYRVAMGRVLRGWAVAALGDAEAGIEEIVRGLHASRRTGARMDDPHYLGLLADAYLRAGEIDPAEGAIEEALAVSQRERSLFYEPELLRMRSVAALRRGGDRAFEVAEGNLREAVETAREQSSRSLELRAASALARLCREQGRGSHARAALATVYESFTEGFETHDLQAAAELLGRSEPAPV